MNIKPTVKQEAKDLNIRIRGLLPLAYHSCLEAISPTSMGSAGLKYDKVIDGLSPSFTVFARHIF